MKILMLTTSYPKYAGDTTAPFIEEIAAGLVQRGHCVHVVAPYHPEVRRVPIERGVHLHFFRYAPVPALNIWGYAEALRADVGVRGNAFLAAPFALPAGLLALIQQLIHTADRPFDLVHAHWSLPNGPPAALAAGLFGLPLVVSLHGSDVFLGSKHWLFALASAAVFRTARTITACSGDLRERALRLGAPLARTSVIPYGVDVSAFRPDLQAHADVRQRLGLPHDARIILSMSRLVYKKGLTYLLDAFAQIHATCPQARLVIAGYGDLRAELDRRAHELGLSEVVCFPGQLERSEAARFISAADVYVVPSIRDQAGNIDGLPNALLEGMAAACPIVASRVAGIPDVITHRQHGLLVPERDPGALAQAILELLCEPDLAQRLGDAARQRVQHELTWEIAAQRFEAAYHG